MDFTIEPHDVVALHNESHLWECEATGEHPIEYIWKHNGTVVQSTNRRIVLVNGRLWFEEVVAEDSGHYQCCARNYLGIICSPTAEFKIASKLKKCTAVRLG